MEEIANLTAQALTCESMDSSKAQHLELCIAGYVCVQRARGLRTNPESEEARDAGALWSRYLSDVALDLLPRIFDRAIRGYTNIREPFGTAQLRKAYLEEVDQLEAAPASAVSLPESVVSSLIMANCKHEYDFEPAGPDEPELIKGYYVCVHCQRAYPAFNRSRKTADKIAYLETALKVAS